MKFRVALLIAVFVLPFSIASHAGEGMWLPQLLKALNEDEMQSLGFKLSAEDIYSINQGSLKDAIVHFGGYCTSEIISSEGLLLTNHHCGFGQIQSHSSVENNYLEDGFWAMNRSEELANPGLTAIMIKRIDDVTEIVLKGVTTNLNSRERQSAIDKNIAAYKETLELEDYEDAVIKGFYKGNQYYMITTITYRDVRLVGAPPSSIGKFGADTDNWVWPRHTGDFALFRIYAGPDNLPADYSEDNVPYEPKKHLEVSTSGVEEGDFTLVFGFPGSTNEYLPSYALEQLTQELNPRKIAIRDAALEIV
ncbi:MAG TPA: S46 family peptidase, partial [Saprospiraceae bacterium]|nr:S46 family peptidase [Saprospiraceae bacterium]